jgi:5-methylcytosine-specific restriction endonuclease McrA
MANFAITRERDDNGRFVIPKSPSVFDREKYKRDYYLKNRDKIIKKVLEWGRKNKDKRRISKKKWAIAHRDHINFLTKMRNFRLKGAGGKISKKIFDDLFLQNGGLCVYCNKNKANSIDHIIPISKGGNNSLINLTIACISCNSKKGNKIL